eukprot:gene696-661_t
MGDLQQHPFGVDGRSHSEKSTDSHENNNKKLSQLAEDLSKLPVFALRRPSRD